MSGMREYYYAEKLLVDGHVPDMDMYNVYNESYLGPQGVLDL
jgi:hypothetical protein